MNKHILVEGDCLGVLPQLPDDHFGLILTDPPFNVGLDYATHDDVMHPLVYQRWCEKWIKELYRVCMERRYCVIFTGDIWLYYVHRAIMNSRWRFHHFLKWHKPGAQTPLKGSVLFNRTELAFLLSKGKPDTSVINRKKLYQDTLTYRPTTPADRDAVDHPARRPVRLYQQIVEGLSGPGECVLDPFLGSGTTMLASANSGRNSVGIEISNKYCNIIEGRVFHRRFLSHQVEYYRVVEGDAIPL